MRYEFKVWLCGYGESVEEAWDDAVESFIDDPGSPPEDDDVETFDEED